MVQHTKINLYLHWWVPKELEMKTIYHSIQRPALHKGTYSVWRWKQLQDGSFYLSFLPFFSVLPNLDYWLFHTVSSPSLAHHCTCTYSHLLLDIFFMCISGCNNPLEVYFYRQYHEEVSHPAPSVFHTRVGEHHSALCFRVDALGIHHSSKT